MEFDHTNRGDMLKLAALVISIPPQNFKTDIAPAVMASGLMKTTFIIEWSIKFLAWRTKNTKLKAWQYMLTKVPDILDGLQAELARHIVSGRDRYDKKSVGGLCAAEVETLVEIISTILSLDELEKALDKLEVA